MKATADESEGRQSNEIQTLEDSPEREAAFLIVVRPE
jgi:hypothetical protein